MKITAQHYHRLVELEKTVHYAESPSDGVQPFILKRGEGKVMLSAPHGAITYRNAEEEVWHEEDEYTAGMALLLNELVQIAVIAMVRKSSGYDPNFTPECSYKDELRRLVQEGGIQYVIDLHGAALFSPTLDPEQTIDLGLRNPDPAKYSMNESHVRTLENRLQATDGNYDPNCFLVKRNKLPAKRDGTVTAFASKLKVAGQDKSVQAIQIEMKPQVRVARRFQTASLYQCCGLYEAHPQCIMHMLQALADFTDYLNALP